MNPTTRRLLHAYRWPITLLGVVAMVLVSVLVVVLFGGWAIGKGVSGSLEASNHVLDRIQHTLSGHAQVTLKQSFLAEIPVIANAGTGRLELAKVDRVETLKSEDTFSLLWDTISLGTSTAEIRVPATYRYYVKLDDPWEIETQGAVCRVQAPRLRTMLPPAIHTHRMEKRSESGWARFNVDEQLENLEQQLTPTLVQYAEDEALMVLVRDQARKSLARFVRHWLLDLRPELSQDIQFVDVRFEGEPTENSDELDPLITLHE
jgi:hypothetical protein